VPKLSDDVCCLSDESEQLDFLNICSFFHLQKHFFFGLAFVDFYEGDPF
jgi:hypothetical protein